VKISDLSAPAARLLLVFLIEGRQSRPRQELQVAAGITNRRTFFRSVAELRRVAAIKTDSYECLPVAPGVTLSGTCSDSEWHPASTSGTNQVTESGTAGSVSGTEYPLLVSPSGTTLIERIQAADLMPSGGERNQKTSEFQVRRRAQMALLIEAWGTVTGSPFALTDINARRMLVAAEDVAEEAYDAMLNCTMRAKASGKSIGPEYVVKTIEGRMRDRKQGPAPRALPSVGVQEPRSGDPYEQKDWTGQEASRKIRQQLERRGWKL
jgi:hypothetical protein